MQRVELVKLKGQERKYHPFGPSVQESVQERESFLSLVILGGTFGLQKLSSK